MPNTHQRSKPRTERRRDPLAGVTLPGQRFVNEYMAAPRAMQRQGISLADYVACGLRDADPTYQLPNELRDVFDDVQRRAEV